jgi:pyruvate/2-oxoglutarate dehydrogenase complex dihydrolipoamide dehydrogenase (E3) component
LAIIGSGTAALTAAMTVRAAGWKVAVTDFRPFGGTCALRGCDPKKMLVSGTAALDYAQRMRNNGVIGDVRIGWPNSLQAMVGKLSRPTCSAVITENRIMRACRVLPLPSLPLQP